MAIPARDEAERIGAALAALAMQRDGAGAPLPDAAFSILVYANNCRDSTAAVCERWAALCPYPIAVVAETTGAAGANAGCARKRAMDLAADRLEREGRHDGAILTTDADSCVATTWVDATLAAFERGVDGVAGYIDAHPAELLALGPAFLRRGRLEDRYLRAAAEVFARCDPRAHDPWPTHRVSSGASLAVTLAAYRAVGGLPPLPVGEDVALTRVLEEHGFAVRHAMDVIVSTSCRLDGRAPGGAADTMRSRVDDPEAPCDDGIEPAGTLLRRAIAQGRLRREWRAGAATLSGGPNEPFERRWAAVQAEDPALHRRAPLRPADLPREIARLETIVRRLRRWT